MSTYNESPEFLAGRRVVIVAIDNNGVESISIGEAVAFNTNAIVYMNKGQVNFTYPLDQEAPDDIRDTMVVMVNNGDDDRSRHVLVDSFIASARSAHHYVAGRLATPKEEE